MNGEALESLIVSFSNTYKQKTVMARGNCKKLSYSKQPWNLTICLP